MGINEFETRDDAFDRYVLLCIEVRTEAVVGAGNRQEHIEGRSYNERE